MSNSDNIYMLIRRRYSPENESYEYKSIGGPSSYDKINKLALRKKGIYRDLYIMCDAARISNITEESAEVYVVGENGIARKAPSTPTTWIKLWEGNNASATGMIRSSVSYGVEGVLVIEAVLNCVRTVLHYVPKSERSTLGIFSELEKFFSGDSSYTSVQSSASSISNLILKNASMSMPLDYVTYAIAHAVWMLKTNAAATVNVDAGHAAQSVSYAMTCLQAQALPTNEFPEIVRNVIPLETLLLAMTAADVSHKDVT